MQEGKLVRYKSFVSTNKCNTGQRSLKLEPRLLTEVVGWWTWSQD